MAETSPSCDAVAGATAAAQVLRAVFDHATPRVPALSRPQLVAAATWLRERAGHAVSTGCPPRAVYGAAVPLALVLHENDCTRHSGSGVVRGAHSKADGCASAASVARVVELDATARVVEADAELGAALAVDPVEAVLALAALVAALVVVVDGPGAGAVIRALTFVGD